ncbi:hypothetical protein NA57DRAFT_50971 [Rhizodiscina lignyota]|uniref:Uncharacterized protein n=1 Tax=Rhizodiscina lignyota TaxID=1504668 RepID=A0A9P4MB95_9PEZI|nr:hypothetical protein NA57DRAFT_50971 [Rhizodiscina lignyota]
MAPITSLPEEIVEITIDYITEDVRGWKDILNLRLTCRDLNAKTLHAVGEHFFTDRLVFIYIKRSLDQIIDISRHQTFRKYVLSIQLVGYCLNFSEEDVTADSLARCYGAQLASMIDVTNFLKYWHDQNWLKATASNIRMLASAIDNLPNSVMLQTREPSPTDLRQLCNLAGDILILCDEDVHDIGEVDRTGGKPYFPDFEHEEDDDSDFDSEISSEDGDGLEEPSEASLLGFAEWNKPTSHEGYGDWNIDNEWPKLFCHATEMQPRLMAEFVIALIVTLKVSIKQLHLASFWRIFYPSDALWVPTDQHRILRERLMVLQDLTISISVGADSEALVRLLTFSENLWSLCMLLGTAQDLRFFDEMASKAKFEELTSWTLYGFWDPSHRRTHFFKPSTIVQFLSNFAGSFFPCVQYMYSAMQLEKLTLCGIDEHLYNIPESECDGSYTCSALKKVLIDHDMEQGLKALTEDLRKSCLSGG